MLLFKQREAFAKLTSPVTAKTGRQSHDIRENPLKILDVCTKDLESKQTEDHLSLQNSKLFSASTKASISCVVKLASPLI